jgi:MtN3 and saliva related transmembrane protein
MLVFSAVDVIGCVASALSTICFLPQAYRVVTTRNTKGMSAATFLLLVITNASWLTYGTLIGNFPIAATNMWAMAVNGLILSYIVAGQTEKIPAERREICGPAQILMETAEQ